jgi:GT2 family glycosyltransferase/glycosyltransferase involved in cell wall biosynthesis
MMQRLKQALELLQERGLRRLTVHPASHAYLQLPRHLRWLRLRRPRRWGQLALVAQDYKLLARSPLFDPEWYLARNADVARSGANPILHYLIHGAAEGRAPGPHFDARAYLEANPDVAASGANPLVRHLRDGTRERRPCSSTSIGTGPTRTRPGTGEASPGWLRPGGTDDGAARERAARWCTDDHPEVSVLIVNWNAAALTLECIRQLRASTEGHTYEIVVADNGSAEADVARLRGLGPGVRLLELGCNRYFGEANNVAAEAARGRTLCLLNNDAFVQPGWLAALVEALVADPRVGAVGPLFLFPDGTVQEAGAAVDRGGYPVQLGRGRKKLPPALRRPRFVDYVSAAAVLVPRDVFMEAGGFDLAYEPVFYEDTDLCLKIQALGRKILYAPAARVVHIEGASAGGDPVREARRNALWELNRGRFVARWGTFLETRAPEALARVRSALEGAAAPAGMGVEAGLPDRAAAVYSPYELTPGAGQRHVLTMALALSRRHRVTVVTPHPYSALRLRCLGRELGLDLSRLQLATEDEHSRAAAPDLMLVTGDRVAPVLPGRGERNVYHWRSPLAAQGEPSEDAAALLAGYDAVVVDSEYARSRFLAFASTHGLRAPAVEVLPPPVPRLPGDAARKKRMILSVGRFFGGSPSERHELLVEAFSSIAARLDAPLELHLADPSARGPGPRDPVAALRESEVGYPIHLHAGVPPEKLRELYRDAAVYWHASGLGVDLQRAPERVEGFGTHLVEAMSAEAVCFALDAGGSRELLSSGHDGFLCGTLDELAGQTLALLRGPPARMLELGRAAGLRALQYSGESFQDRFETLVRRLEEAPVARPGLP